MDCTEILLNYVFGYAAGCLFGIALLLAFGKKIEKILHKHFDI
jgi:hypothetical protein